MIRSALGSLGVLAVPPMLSAINASCEEKLTPKMAPAVYTFSEGDEKTTSFFLVKDQIGFEKKLAEMRRDGPSRLQIVTDFDFTLTKFYQKSYGRGYSCHKTIEDCGFLSDDYHTKAQALQRKYYPLEIDPSLEEETRIKYMVEWVTKAHALLETSGLTEDTLKKAVATAVVNGGMALRPRVQELLSLTQSLDVPVLIFSAGIANVLEEVLRIELGLGVLPRHVSVASNRIIFDKTGGIQGFTEPLFHVFNKRASALEVCEPNSLDELQDRTNVLLFGDSLGDLNMSQGLTQSNIIKVGFLNDRLDRLPEYLSKFDVVILGDPGMDVSLKLLRDIASA
jgi:cytosolic 5'-nucleotidase 3